MDIFPALADVLADPMLLGAILLAAVVADAAVDTIAPGGATLRTGVSRLYARRPSRLPAPVTVDARAAGAARGGRRGIKGEGTPACRIYRVRPRSGG